MESFGGTSKIFSRTSGKVLGGLIIQKMSQSQDRAFERSLMASVLLQEVFFFFFFCLLSFVLSGVHPWHMEVPRLGSNQNCS